MNKHHIFFYLAAVLLVSGCMSNDMSDLHEFVDEVKKTKRISLPKLPEFPTEEIYIYTHAAGMVRDPFVSLEQEKKEITIEISAQANRPECGPPPDIYRKKEELENFPLDALNMVGTLSENNTVWGLVVDPRGFLTKVQVNNYVGQNNGKIVHIGETKIEVREMVNDGTGCFVERESSLAMKEEG